MSFSSTIERTQNPELRAVSVRCSRQIKAPPERIFDAWLDAAEARAFLFASRVSEPVDSEIDACVGGRFRIVRRSNGKDIEYSGEYLEIDRPRRLVFSLYVEEYAQRDDCVVVEIAPVEQESLLVVTHELSLQSLAERGRIQAGWAAALDRLAASCGESTPRMSWHRLRAPDRYEDAASDGSSLPPAAWGGVATSFG
jgi:uncharacterized protein YndB with AHSA1/START domain